MLGYDKFLSNFISIFCFFSDYIVNRTNRTRIPDMEEVRGAAFGVGRLHSLYSLKTDQLVNHGIIDAKIKNEHILSGPSVTKLSSKFILCPIKPFLGS